MDKRESFKNTPGPSVIGGSGPQAEKHTSHCTFVPRQSFDREYVERLIQGDRPTEMHFSRYFGELLLIKLRARLGSTHLVEDLRQDTFVRVLTVLRRKGGLESPESLGAFVNSVCNNVLFEFYRAQSRTRTEPIDAVEPRYENPDAESLLITEERKRKVQEVLRSLSERDRKLLRMIFYDNLDKAWVCQAFCVDREHLRVLIHRAKARFRNFMLADPNEAAT
jgi:RNA polymerase sigma-70 factor (ECF subfamily)